MGRSAIAHFLGQTPVQRIAILLSLLEAAIVITVESILIHFLTDTTFTGDATDTTKAANGIPVYLIIFIFAEIMLCYLIHNTIKEKNSIQLIGIIFFHACCILYSALQFSQIKKIYDDRAASLLSNPSTYEDLPEWSQIRAGLIIVLVTVATSWLIFIYLAVKLFDDFGWTIFKKIGADVKKKRMYRSYHIFLMLLKLDVFFFLGFAVQFMVLILDSADIERSLTIAALPLGALILLAAWYGVRKEKKAIMIVFMVGNICAIVYFLFKTVRMWTGVKRDKFDNFRIYLTVFSVLSLTMSIVTLFMAIVCYRNFGKGLLRHHMQKGGPGGVDAGPERRAMALETEQEAHQDIQIGELGRLPQPPLGISTLPPSTGGLARGGSVYVVSPSQLQHPDAPMPERSDLGALDSMFDPATKKQPETSQVSSRFALP